MKLLKTPSTWITKGKQFFFYFLLLLLLWLLYETFIHPTKYIYIYRLYNVYMVRRAYFCYTNTIFFSINLNQIRNEIRNNNNNSNNSNRQTQPNIQKKQAIDRDGKNSNSSKKKKSFENATPEKEILKTNYLPPRKPWFSH